MYAFSLLALLASLLIVSRGQNSCCFPSKYQGTYYKTETYVGYDSLKVFKSKVDVYIDHVNKREYFKYKSEIETALKYEILLDFSPGGYEYVTSGGACLFKVPLAYGQSDRCKLCHSSTPYDDQTYGATPNRLSVNYRTTNCTIPLTENEPRSVVMGGNFIQVHPNGTLPVYFQGTYTLEGIPIRFVADYVNFELQIKDQSVFHKPISCMKVKSMTQRRLNAILRNLFND